MIPGDNGVGQVELRELRRLGLVVKNNSPEIGGSSMYDVPDFNLDADLWTGTQLPSTHAPTHAGFPCQKFVTSRVVSGVEPRWQPGLTTNPQIFFSLYTPPIVLRFPRTGPWAGPWSGWLVGVIECPSGSLQYYLLRWGEVMHEGFPNEYAAALCEQCRDDGSPFWPASGLWD